MNEVYVIAGGEWLRNNLNAIAAFMGTRTWDSIEKIALTLSVLAVAVMWVQRHNVMDLLGWVAVFVLISLLVNVRTSVQIIDNSDLVKVHRVDNVPVGLAMPLSLTTRMQMLMLNGGLNLEFLVLVVGLVSEAGLREVLIERMMIHILQVVAAELPMMLAMILTLKPVRTLKKPAIILPVARSVSPAAILTIMLTPGWTSCLQP